MICPKCKGPTRVRHPNPNWRNRRIMKRRHVCRNKACGHRFNSFQYYGEKVMALYRELEELRAFKRQVEENRGTGGPPEEKGGTGAPPPCTGSPKGAPNGGRR
jgi:hypothetical protein